MKPKGDIWMWSDRKLLAYIPSLKVRNYDFKRTKQFKYLRVGVNSKK